MSWRGHVFLEAGWLLYDGPIAPTTSHAHHAFQIVLVSDPPLRIVAGTVELEVTRCVIPPDASHAFASAAPRAVLLYVAPESREGRQLGRRLAEDVAPSAWIHAATDLAAGTTPIISWVEARRVRDDVIARLVPEETRPFFRDAYDHFVRVVDLNDSFREIVSGSLDAYISMRTGRRGVKR